MKTIVVSNKLLKQNVTVDAVTVESINRLLEVVVGKFYHWAWEVNEVEVD